MRPINIERSITRRDQKSLNHYLSDISRHEVLSVKEEEDLFKRIEQGDPTALRKIVQHNLRFVVSVAKQYQNVGLSLNDLINEGNIGLIKAARRFEVSRGFKFISYAVWWIRQSILEAIANKSKNIKTPANQQAMARKIDRAQRAFTQEHDRQPTMAELADLLDENVDAIRRSIKSKSKCRSLDAKLKAGEDLTLGQLLKDETIAAPDQKLAVVETQRKQIKTLLSHVSSRDAQIISLYYGLEQDIPMSMSSIGDLLGISKERVRQIRDTTLRKLRRRGRNLTPALD